MAMIDDLRQLERDALAAIRAARAPDELERVRVLYLGRREGLVSGMLRRLGTLDPAERPAAGAAAPRGWRC